MRGDRVIVRGYRGKARICRLIEINGDVAQLTDDEGFAVIDQDEEKAKVVLFRVDDLFVDDGTVADDTIPDYQGLVPYAENVLH